MIYSSYSNGLQLREFFHNLMIQELMKNYQMFKNHTVVASFTENDVHSIAKSIEYSVFSRTTDVNMYKSDCWKVVNVAKVNSCTYILTLFSKH